MSRSQDRKYFHSRCSEPTLRRRYSMQLVPTSEEDTSSVLRSRSSSPFLDSSHPPLHRLDRANGCCSCRYSKKKSKSRSDSSKVVHKPAYLDIINQLLYQQKSNGSQQMRGSLEIQLVGSQVEEALASDKQAELIRHLELSTDTLEALIQHVRSLQISHVSVQRVIRSADRLILPHSSTIINYTSSLSTDLVTRFGQAESCKENRLRLLREVVENCSKNITVSKQLQSLIDDHKMKKEDFTVAARNFKNLLDNSKLTTSQMDKLQWQYQAIMDDYRQHRRILDSELPKIIKTRLVTIRQGFSAIASFYEDIEFSKHISDLLKILGETLGQEETETDKRRKEYEKSQFDGDMCQKCKVNRVEKK